MAVVGANAVMYEKYSRLMALQQIDNGFSTIDIQVDG